jgi:hypothetical protein
VPRQGRPDLVPEDLAMMLMADTGVIGATGSAAAQTSPWLVAYPLQAGAAEAARRPSQSSMYQALHRLHEGRDTW